MDVRTVADEKYILGRDMLHKYDAVLDYGRGLVTFRVGGKNVSVFTDNVQGVMVVVVRVTLSIVTFMKRKNSCKESINTTITTVVGINFNNKEPARGQLTYSRQLL